MTLFLNFLNLVEVSRIIEQIKWVLCLSNIGKELLFEESMSTITSVHIVQPGELASL